MRSRLLLVLLMGCTHNPSEPGDDSGVGQRCRPGIISCRPGFFCDYAANDCGASGAAGVCVEDIVTCTDDSWPVCTCGGTIASNPCYGRTDLDARGTCRQEGSFSCGYRVCRDREYCRIETRGTQTVYECGQFTSVEHTCEFVPPHDSCRSNCSNDSGIVTVQCP